MRVRLAGGDRRSGKRWEEYRGGQWTFEISDGVRGLERTCGNKDRLGGLADTQEGWESMTMAMAMAMVSSV